MANRFYTFLLIPEKTASVRRFTVPGWLFRSGLVGGLFVIALVTMMVLDYWYVMGQVDENKEMKIENRRLRQQVQVFKNKMSALESTLNRVQTFTTRLKVITNIEDRTTILQSLNSPLPDANENLPKTADVALNTQTTPEALAAAGPVGDTSAELRDSAEFRELEKRFSGISEQAFQREQELQDLYELLIDQKGFLAALPGRKPSVGYFTSGFGIRHSPFGDAEKMHEGVDIANRPGTPIRATANGTVKFAGGKPGYGKTIVIDHGYGLETWYGHSRTLLVKKDDQIRRGQKIALMGSTGRSTAPHVHYEVRVNGIPVDPLTYILEE